MSEVEPMSVHDAVASDIEKKYWFAHGETPLGGSDFIRPLRVVGDMVECETGNFHDKISISTAEYMQKREHPMEKVGIWDFAPPSPANRLIRLASRHPQSVGRRLYEAEAERDALQAVVDRIPKDGEGMPVLLGDNRFAVKLSSVVVECGFLDLQMEEIDVETVEYWGTVRDADGAQWRCRTTDTYPTRAAALAASSHSATEAEGE